MSDPMLFSQIEALAKRIETLESDRCDCLKCIQRNRERERVAVVAKYGAIAMCTDREARNAMIAALTPHEQVVYLSQHVTDPAIVLDAPDAMIMESWLDRVQPGVAMRVRLALVERSGKLPRTVRVRMASPTSTWTRSELTIDDATAKRLREVMPDRVGGHPLAEHTTVYYPFAFPAIGDTYRTSAEAVEAAKSVDSRFAEAVDSGRVVVEPCTIDEDRARQLTAWSQR
jgi:hypothetical protein